MAEVIATPQQAAHGTSGAQAALSVRQVKKAYGSRDSVTHALDGVSFDVMPGEFVGIMGPSGSGKTTLLNCVSAIDKVTGGKIAVGGQDIAGMRRGALAKFRRDRLGFIFQDFNLLETLTAFENIALGLTIKHVPPAQISRRVQEVAQMLGVAEVLGKYPHQMSGGQKQRVAAARAIVGDPELILADEPTGALDSRSATVLLETLEVMNRDMGATIMMVTHDSFAASFTDRVLFIKDGRLFNEIRRGDAPRRDFFTRIVEVVSFLSADSPAEAATAQPQR